MYLNTTSRGHIDPLALCLMGASVKDEGAIGEFGSGMKYAIATLLRHNVDLKVFSGETEITITTEPAEFRGERFDRILVNGMQTSLTTRTGPKWRIIDAVREVWSNALDEGQAARYEGLPRAKDGISTISIALCDEIRDMLANWGSYFLEDAALDTNLHGSIHRSSSPNFFRRGVWICEDRDNVPLFSYNFNDFSLPESRRVSSGGTYYNLMYLLSECRSVEVFEEIFKHPTTRNIEWLALNYHYGQPNPALLEAFKWECFGNQELRQYIDTDRSVYWCGEYQCAVLEKQGLKDIAKLYNISEAFTVKPWPIGLQDQTKTEARRLKAVGIDLFPYTWRFAEFKRPETIAMAHNGTMLLSDAAFRSNRDLRKAMIEEWTHLKHGVADHTVAQQHVYLNLILDIMEGK